MGMRGQKDKDVKQWYRSCNSWTEIVHALQCTQMTLAKIIAEDGEIPERYPLSLLPTALDCVPQNREARHLAEQYRAPNWASLERLAGGISIRVGGGGCGDFESLASIAARHMGAPTLQ